MARPKKITIKLSDGKDILFNDKFNENLDTMNDKDYKRYMAAKQHALKTGQNNIKNRLSNLSLNDFDTIQEYNKTWADLKHYVNIVADMIKENKRAFHVYFNETSTVDDFLKV